MIQHHPPGIRSLGRWLVFFGVPLAFLGIILTSTLPHGLEPGLARVFGEKALPYVLFFIPVTVSVGGLMLHNHLPKRLILPLGTLGWIVGLVLVGGYFWCNPGLFRNQNLASLNRSSFSSTTHSK